MKHARLGLAVLLAAGCTHSGGPAPKARPVAHAQPVAAALQSFGDCDALVTALRKEAIREVTPWGLSPPTYLLEDRAFGSQQLSATSGFAVKAARGAAAVTDHSATNVQESDVDEPDTVKTDGTVMVASAHGFLQVVDVTHAKPVSLSSLRLHLDRPQLLLDGDTVVALGQVYRKNRVVTVVEIVDISDPTTPTAVRRFRLDGSMLDARVVHGRVVVAVSSSPRLVFPAPKRGVTADQMIRANRAVIARATVSELLPEVTVTPGGGTYRAGCTSTMKPGVDSGVQRTSLITLDPAKDAPTQHVTVIGNASTLYASGSALYLATNPWAQWRRGPAAVSRTDGTDLHGFDVTEPDHLRYLGTGSVPGSLLDQYAMSEQDGYLRVATNTGQDNRITVLKPRQGVLAEVAHVAGLGVGERIFGVRFLGDTAYVVTFRQLDPLHVVDLSDPTRPVARGELKVPGYSSALYPLGNHQLLGLGQDRGTAASVFDTSDSAHPKLLSKTVLKNSWSAAERDHHALLWWPKTRTVAFPSNGGAVVLKVSKAGDIGQQGRINAKGGVERLVVVGDLLYSVSGTGITATPLERLDETTWLPFP